MVGKTITGRARTTTGGITSDGTEGTGLLYSTDTTQRSVNQGYTGHEHLQQNGLIHMNG